jgi:hypothetical protein
MQASLFFLQDMIYHWPSSCVSHKIFFFFFFFFLLMTHDDDVIFSSSAIKPIIFLLSTFSSAFLFSFTGYPRQRSDQKWAKQGSVLSDSLEFSFCVIFPIVRVF